MALLHITLPAVAIAAGEHPPLPPVLITEVQAGSSASASEEFIELFNTTAESIDFSAHSWQLQIASSSATNWDSPQRTITLSGVLAPGASYVAASQYTSSGTATQYLPAIADTWFSAGITATAGHIRLIYETYQQQGGACALADTVVDQVEWSAPKDGAAATPSIGGRTVFVAAKSTGLAGGTSLQRTRIADTQLYQDSGSDAADFAPATAPGPGTVNELFLAAGAVTVADNNVVDLPEDGCDPDPPQTDPGDTEDDSTDSDGSDGGSADDTADEEASDTAVIPAADQGLQPPRITELLPNPGSPQTDAEDEFIELYNPNDVQFDLSNFILEVGTTTKRRYSFADGTTIAAGAYVAFYSAATGLSLGNSGGQARLLDPLGAVLSATDAYGTAKDNQAWAFAQDKWQWTLSPTPNAANAVLLAQAKAAKTTAAKKTAAKKAAASKATKKTAPQTAAASTVATETAAARSPLHPGVLAVIGVFAVLYGAYEYRQDMANYFRRFREHRKSGREDRPEAAGRGDH